MEKLAKHEVLRPGSWVLGRSSVLWSCVLASALSLSGSAQTPAARAFTGARLIDGDAKVIAPKGVVVVRNGRIEAVGAVGSVTVPKDAEVVDVGGRTIMPGLVNAHGHVADTSGLQTGAQFYTEANLVRQLRAYASYGVTSVMSLGGDGDVGFKLRDAQNTAGLDRARIFVAGPVITAATPEAARAEVDRVAAMKPDWLKIRVDDQLGTARKMPIEVARAVIEQGHARGFKVAVHIFYLEDAKALLKAGADYIAHSVRDLPVDAELIALLKARNICLCPTLTREVSAFAYGSEPAFFADPYFQKGADPAVVAQLKDPARMAQMANSASAKAYRAGLEVAKANAKKLADAGVTIASGTDTGPPARFQGFFEHLEAEMLGESGLSAPQILAAATGNAAICLGLKDVGFLRKGGWADLLVLAGDPLKDPKALRTIESVWIAGRKFQ